MYKCENIFGRRLVLLTSTLVTITTKTTTATWNENKTATANTNAAENAAENDHRSADDWLVALRVASVGRCGALIDLCSETYFVART